MIVAHLWDHMSADQRALALASLSSRPQADLAATARKHPHRYRYFWIEVTTGPAWYVQHAIWPRDVAAGVVVDGVLPGVAP